MSDREFIAGIGVYQRRSRRRRSNPKGCPASQSSGMREPSRKRIPWATAPHCSIALRSSAISTGKLLRSRRARFPGGTEGTFRNAQMNLLSLNRMSWSPCPGRPGWPHSGPQYLSCLS